MKGIENRLDIAWSKLVKLRARNKCEYCHKPTGLNSHHIYSRSKRSTRWDVDNGISLCASHHTLSSTFSAHKTPIEFVEWFTEYKGGEFIDRLRLKANTIQKHTAADKRQILDGLNKEIKRLENGRH